MSVSSVSVPRDHHASDHPRPLLASGMARLDLASATIRLWEAFGPLAPERRRWALTVGVVDTVRAGDEYAASGDVAVVVSGCLAIDAPVSGLTAEMIGPGGVAGTGNERHVFGRWVTDGELYRVPLDTWIDSAGLDGVVHILQAVDERRAKLGAQVRCFAVHRAAARVADLVLAVHRTASESRILLSQERIGVMLGLRRTTVNSACRALERAGASRTRRGEIRIIDLAALEQAACGCHRFATHEHHQSSGDVLSLAQLADHS